MPGIITHHLFGIDAYQSCTELVGNTSATLDAFLLGNLGPDPFFYLMASPMTNRFRRLGQTMHKKRTPELLFAMHEHFITDPPKLESAACKAYALGFLCHYLLDSTVHPLVYAQQHAICDAKVEGLTQGWSHRVVHATIETALDEYVLTAKLGATTAALPPHKTMLRCPAPALVGLSHAYSLAINDTFDLNVPEATFVSAVSLNRLAQQTLDSKSIGVRRHFDYLAGMGMASAYVLALSHRDKPLPQTPFANDDHTTWEIPFSDGKTISASFDELRIQALDRAQELLPEYAKPSFSLEACEELVGNVNFLGRAVER